MSPFFLAAFKGLSFFYFDSLIIVWLGVDLFWFILVGVFWDSWIWMFFPFLRSGKVLAIISSNKLSAPFLSLFSSGTSMVWIMIHLMVSYMSFGLCSLSFVLFSFCSSDSIISDDLSLSLLILSSAQSSLLLIPSSNVFNSIIIFFSSRICLILFNHFSLLIFLLFHALFSWFCLAVYLCSLLLHWVSLRYYFHFFVR